MGRFFEFLQFNIAILSSLRWLHKIPCLQYPGPRSVPLMNLSVHVSVACTNNLYMFFCYSIRSIFEQSFIRVIILISIFLFFFFSSNRIYQNPVILRAASKAFWTSCHVISKLLWCTCQYLENALVLGFTDVYVLALPMQLGFLMLYSILSCYKLIDYSDMICLVNILLLSIPEWNRNLLVKFHVKFNLESGPKSCCGRKFVLPGLEASEMFGCRI